MGMQIRQAQAEDIPALGRLLEQVEMVHHLGRPDLFKRGGRKYNDDQLRELLCDVERRPILVAADETSGQVVGYAFCMLVQHINDNVLTDVRTLYLDDLCVDETLRGQHVGRVLYDAVLALARERGCYNVTLNVWSCNPAAMRFYEKCGLVPQKVGMEVIL